MRADPDRSAVYGIEPAAYEGTPLADKIAEADLSATYAAALREIPELSHIIVLPARADMTKWGGYCQGSTIRTSASRVQRWTVAHELAHALANTVWYRSIEPCDPTSHGASWRALNTYLVGRIFGWSYAEVLRSAFETAGLFVATAETDALPVGSPDPIINIDALSITTAPTGGWRRPQ